MCLFILVRVLNEPPRDIDIADTGLAHLPGIMFDRHDHALITAFLERWQPETNSFHLLEGEVTITLEDVHRILGIQCHGEPVRLILAQPGEEEAELERFRAHFASALEVKSYHLAKLWTIIKDRRVDRQIREAAYLGYIVGSTLFIDKTGTKIMRSLVELFRDGQRGANKAWGAATLTFLYRQLGIASRVGTSSMSGCLTLLEVRSFLSIFYQFLLY